MFNAKKKRRTTLETLPQDIFNKNPDPIPSFEEAEKLFLSNEKAKNRLKRTIQWHRENLHCVKKALTEQGIALDLEKIN